MTAPITGTGSITGITPITLPQLSPAATGGASGQFGDMLAGAIQSIEGANHQASTAVQNFLSGQNEELHTTVLATQKAEMAFELGLQVRNKVVDAYQEVMKMQM
jgi:flagellar hook-basal body complex protein FliE